MIQLAYRNIFQSKIRLLISTGGVALSLMLILSLDAIFTGVERQITAYIDNSQADIFVSQVGVKNMHMASSSLPAEVEIQLKAVTGVKSVTPILYLSNVIVIGEERHLAYIIGLPENASVGKPPSIVKGNILPGPGQAVIDRRVAEASGVSLGDEVEILGETFIISGLSEGLSSLVNSIGFISIIDFKEMRSRQDIVSFFLIEIEEGDKREAISKTIENEVENVSVQTTEEFSLQERQVVKDMGTDIITIMNLVGFSIGLAVLSLTIYTAIFSRRAEYGVLKAMGASNMQLYRAVVYQALISVSLSFLLGWFFTLLLSIITPQLGYDLQLIISQGSFFKVLAAALIIGGLSALLPVRQISSLDPAIVFRGK